MTQSVPSGWTIVRLGEIGDALIGLTYEPRSIRRSGTLVLRSSNVQDGALAFADNVYVDCAIPDRIRIRDQDILICVRNGSRRLIGKSAMVDQRVVGQTFGAFMAVFRSDTNPYLRYFFQSGAFKRQIDEHLGATINQITNGSLKSFVVALPGEPERTAITERLHDVDALIMTLRRLMVKKRCIKRGVMQQLLTGRMRLSGFTGKWEPKSLRDDVTLVSGHHILARHCNTRGHGVPYLTGPADFPDGRIRQTKFTTRPTALCQANDLLVTVKGSGAGTLVEADAPYCISRQLMAIRTNEWDSRFLLYSLLENAASIKNAVTGLIPGLSRSDILDQTIPVPLVDEQRAIAAVLSNMDAELEAIDARLAKTLDIKQGMMQELLTGQTRLPILEAVA
jgi:type I restriction enzyme, S subunit